MFFTGLILSVSIAQAQSFLEIQGCKAAAIQHNEYVSAAVKKQNLDLCLASKKNAQAAITLRTQISTLKEKEAECFKDDRGFFARAFNTSMRSPTQADVERCDKERKAKEAQLAALEDNLKLQEQQSRVAEGNYAAQRDVSKATAEQRAQTDALVKSEFDTIKISILDTRLQASDAAFKLTKMATALDNSAMGLYLRERMAGLLNSNAMCAAVKECPKPGKVKGADLNSVFNSTMNTGVNSESQVTSSAPAGTAKSAADTAK